ncbi:alpha/beta-hydrolase [Microstroma glucosiphilum]|uniref:Alpha/beta-hydrolase n=1 Tax=Pseudomicrostroma glucosiphilum TaxID=1684307 RepID=A0A316TZZ6_9BASI|nr:alpha/beta-hydrolase [Pseudomicrostroma glucosiphilum]PWN18759.1 alpha/beta-hydrolase [Pseudomicrostroma glucosiphilum]
MGGHSGASKPQQRRQANRPTMPTMSKRAAATTSSTPASTSSSVHSRGQQARRDSFTRARDGVSTMRPGKPTRRNSSSQHQRPVLGGMTALDLVLIAAAYAINLIKTLAIAELVDIAAKSLWYCFTSLPFDFYRRWTLSHPQPVSPESEPQDSDVNPASNVFRPSQRPHPLAPPPSQLSPFHHLVILITRFACMNFPHLLPRVLFAEDTMLPFVGWRTGGASWELMKEIRGEPIKTDSSPSPVPAFRAIWMGPDAYASSESRRQSETSRQASTILYLHGGGFSLGSVSFYAEALLRVLNKVCRFEAADPSAPLARCVAVEYDLGPTARFPAPLLQCLRCYAHLIEVERLDPSSITFAGDSAGGNLALAMLLTLNGQGGKEVYRERDWTKLPLPGKALLISPWVDLRPSQAHAFAALRKEEEMQRDTKQSAKSSHKKQSSFRDSLGTTTSHPEPSEDLTAAITSYEWDYVASETLLHFAQVYAGVLERPRRVIGPLGWVAHLGGILSRGLEEESQAGEAGQRKGKKATRTTHVADPARRLARAVKDFLEHPLFEQLVPKEELVRTSPPLSTAVVQPSFTSGLAPIFSSRERETDAVRSTKDLYFPILSSPSSASADLDSNPLLSPILGDWSKIQLERGCLVTWGERERMSADIEAWVELVHSGKSPEDLTPSRRDDRPRQDGEEERERYERLQRGKWLKTAVEHGSGGVHAWPFVAMYLAGTEAEREKGLELLGRFIARPIGGDVETLMAAEAAYSRPPDNDTAPSSPAWHQRGEDVSPPYSPGSLPSDIGEESEYDEGDEPADGSQSPMFTSRGGGRAFTEAEFKEVMGLGVQYGREPVMPGSPSSSRSAPTPPAPAPLTPPASTPSRETPIAPTTPPSRAAQLGRVDTTTTIPAYSPSLSSGSASPASSMKGSISRRMEREHSSGQISRGRKAEPTAPPLWWTNTPVGAAPAALPAQEVTSQVQALPRFESDEDDLEQDVDADTSSSSQLAPALSTLAYSSSPSRAAPRSDSDPGSEQLKASYFGLSYALRREAEEGLSDIAEESSVMSSGFASIAGGAGGGAHAGSSNLGPGAGAALQAGFSSSPGSSRSPSTAFRQPAGGAFLRYADDAGSLDLQGEGQLEEEEEMEGSSSIYSPVEFDEEEDIGVDAYVEEGDTIPDSDGAEYEGEYEAGEKLDDDVQAEVESESESEEGDGDTDTIGRRRSSESLTRTSAVRGGEAWWASGAGAAAGGGSASTASGRGPGPL